MKRSLLLLAACGGSAAPHARPPSPVAEATAAPERAPERASEAPSVAEAPESAKEALPDANAPVTPPKIYDAKQCKERVATFASRAVAAYDHTRNVIRISDTTPFADQVDPGLSTPLVVRILPRGDMEGDWCGAWITEVVVNGKAVATDTGKQRRTKTLAAVKKHLAKGGTIGVKIMPHLALDTIEPLLLELQAIGPLALGGYMVAGDFPVVLDDAPAWARERYQAHELSGETKILSNGVRDAVSDCPAHKAANDKVLADEAAGKGWVIAHEYPKAVAACACKGIDVDALELFTVELLGGHARVLTEGFLDVNIDPKSSTKLAAPTSRLFTAQLSKLTREQRRAGVALDTGGGPPTMTRCK